MATISAEVSVPRTGTGPRFQLDPGPSRYAAVEVARERALLAPESRPGGGPAPGFHGSWEGGRLTADQEYRLPAAAWADLRTGEQLYYRCVTSAAPDAWVDVIASTPDDHLGVAPAIRIVEVGVDATQVPPEQLDRLWREVLRDPRAARLSATPGASAAVVRHSTSPRRPFSPRSVVWVVTVVGPPEGGSVTEVVVPVHETGEIGEVRHWRAASRPTGSDDALGSARAGLDAPLADAVAAQPARFARLGPVWVWQDGAPAPTEGVGGTVLVSASTGELLFASGTSW